MHRQYFLPVFAALPKCLLLFFAVIYLNCLDCHSASKTNMLKKERQSFILRQVNLHNKVLSSDLSQEMCVSEDTIRRDLNELSEEDKVIKVHGGALSKSFHLSLRSPNIYSKDKKKIIAQKAAALVQDGMFVLTSGGTTL